MVSTEPVFEVVAPVGEQAEERTGATRTGGEIIPAVPLSDLSGRKIGLIWTTFSNGNVLLEALGELLTRRYQGLDVVKIPAGRNLNWGDYPDRSLSSFARENKLDAAIVAAAC